MRVIVKDARDTHGLPRWRDLDVGNGLTYADGSLFIIESREINDKKHVTFLVRCVVPSEDSVLRYSDLGMLTCEINSLIPEGCSIVRSTR